MHALPLCSFAGDVTPDGQQLPVPAGHITDKRWSSHTVVSPSIRYASQYSGYLSVPGLPGRIELVLQLLQKPGTCSSARARARARGCEGVREGVWERG
jgi:hypothetical protein